MPVKNFVLRRERTHGHFSIAFGFSDWVIRDEEFCARRRERRIESASGHAAAEGQVETCAFDLIDPGNCTQVRFDCIGNL